MVGKSSGKRTTVGSAALPRRSSDKRRHRRRRRFLGVERLETRRLLADGLPSLTIAGTQVDEPAGTATLTVNLSAPSETAVTVQFRTVDGTAGSPGDYTAKTGTLTFEPLAPLAQTITVAIVDDSQVENSETFTVELLNPSGAQLQTSSGVVTIFDQAALSIAPATQTVAEGATAMLTVQLDNGKTAPAEGLSFYFTVSDTPPPPANPAIGGTLTIPAGQSSITFPLQTVDDQVIAPDQTLWVWLAITSHERVLPNQAANTAQITIQDNDATTVSVVATDATATEGGPDDGQFTVTLDNGKIAPAEGIEIHYQVSGTATASSDYAPLSEKVTIAGGQSSATIPVHGLDDNLVEGTETVVLTVTGTDHAQVTPSPTAAAATVSLIDADSGTVGFSGDARSALEGTNPHPTVALHLNSGVTLARPILVDVTVLDTGTATLGADYTFVSPTTVTFAAGSTDGATQQVAVTLLDDNRLEGDETVPLRLGNVQGPASAAVSLAAASQHTLTITDSDSATLSFTAASNSGTEGGTAGPISVALHTGTGVTLERPLSVAVTNLVTSTATAGSDFSFAGSTTLKFPVDSPDGAVQSVSVSLLDDNRLEGDETIRLGLTTVEAPAGAGVTVATPSEYIVTITDTDTASVAFAAGTSTAAEGTAAFPVGLVLHLTSGVTLERAVAVEISAQATGTATSGADFTFTSPPTVTFPADSGNGAVQNAAVSIVADKRVEGSETFGLGLSSILAPAGATATLASPLSHTVTITDGDAATIAFAAAVSNAAEGTNSHPVAVTLHVAAGVTLERPVMVDVVDQVTGTATVTTDYTFISSPTVMFPAGSGDAATQTIGLSLPKDNRAEDTETVELGLASLQAPAGAAVTLAPPSAHTVSIFDANTAEVSFAAATSSGAEGTDAFSVGVKLHLQPGVILEEPFTLDVVDLGTGTAAAGLDYVFSPVTLTFPAGSFDGTVVNAALALRNDDRLEGNETVLLGLTNIQAAAGSAVKLLAPSQHTLTITDADTATLSFAAAASPGAEGTNVNVGVVLHLAEGVTLERPVSARVADLGTGTATAGTDFTLASPATVTFTAGSSDGATQNVTATLRSDNLVEGSETAILGLANIQPPTGAAVTTSSPSEHTLTIADTNAATVSFATASSANREGTAAHAVGVILQVPSGVTLERPITVDVIDNVMGTATAGTDYTLTSPARVMFPAGSGNGATQMVTPPLLDDNRLEGDETFQLGLANVVAPTGATVTLAALSQHTVTITDADTATISFAASSSTGAEGANVSLGVTLDLDTGVTLERSLSVNVIDRATGTATGGTDYTFTSPTPLTFAAGSADGATQTATVALRTDSLVEGAETIALGLANVQAPTGAAVTLATPSEHTLTITDTNTATVSFAAATSSAAEGTAAHPLSVVLHLPTGVTLQRPISVSVVDRATGTATAGTDYTLANLATVTFAAGSGDGVAQTVTLALLDDNRVEGHETIVLGLGSLQPPTGATVTLATPNEHTVTLTDTDSATISFAAASSTGAEGTATQTVSVVLHVSSGVTLERAVSVTVSDQGTGTATTATDYTLANPATVTFSAGSGDGAAQNATVALLDDNRVEGSETILLGLTGLQPPAGATVTVATPSSHTLTITDADSATVAFSAATARSAEGVASQTITVVLNVLTGVTLERAFSVDVTDLGTGTATRGTDYNFTTPTTLTFAAGSGAGATQTATLTRLPAGAVAGSETVRLGLSNVQAATGMNVATADPSQQVLTLVEEPGSIGGVVYADTNGNGQRDVDSQSKPVESGIPGVNVRLTGTDWAGRTIEITVLTDASGVYSFTGVPAGTYDLIETQPAAFIDGPESLGTMNGTASGTAGEDRFTGVVLPGNGTGINYLFGERGLKPEFVSIRLFLASTPAPTETLRRLNARAAERNGDTVQAAVIRTGEAATIARIGDKVTVQGTTRDDQMEFTPGTTQHTVVVDGRAQTFDASVVKTVRFDGSQGGKDAITLHDSAGNDRLDSSGTTATLTGPNYTAEVSAFEVVRPVSQSGGSDTINRQTVIYDLQLQGPWTPATTSTAPSSAGEGEAAPAALRSAWVSAPAETSDRRSLARAEAPTQALASVAIPATAPVAQPLAVPATQAALNAVADDLWKTLQQDGKDLNAPAVDALFGLEP